MHDRAALGPADLDDDRLASLVADLWGLPAVTLLSSRTERVAYDVPSITTGSRTWVSGVADGGDGPRDFRVFVKVVQNWRRSPYFQFVPPELREWAASTVPWQTEALAYRGDLASALPQGLRMPRALAVVDLDEESRAIWLEAIDTVDDDWGRETYTEAAFLLGRLAGSADVREHAELDPMPWEIDPTSGAGSSTAWCRPCSPTSPGSTPPSPRPSSPRCATGCAPPQPGSTTSLRNTAACRSPPPTATLRPATCCGWPASPASCSSTSTSGARSRWATTWASSSSGTSSWASEVETTSPSWTRRSRTPTSPDSGPRVTRRPSRWSAGDAVSMHIFSGISALPVEDLDQPDSPELRARFEARAALATYSLDLLESTAPRD